MQLRPTLALAGFLILALSSCAANDGMENAAQPQTQINISAATSLHEPFEQLAQEFREQHLDILLSDISYDGSATLATQIIAGAPADVFASADERNMDALQEAGLVATPSIFATNTLVIALPQGNPGNISELADLAEATTVLCAPEVPCGSAAKKLLDLAGVQVEAASLEQNVGTVLVKVATGEADAGLVYRTEMANEPTAESIIPPEAQKVVNSYPISVVANASGDKQEVAKREAAEEFVDYVLSEHGQQVMREYGFGSPTSSAQLKSGQK
ncbi:molybdate ABC transporter substrate-binding protein [Glutamicibacter sp. AOP33-2CA-4]|uniref:molybdate ABC transporter substrate-binding protein n=1 Tax=Glutamicibacter sp. AOP33-2CA-4 TaxID=3457690 RepID=UPI004033919A